MFGARIPKRQLGDLQILPNELLFAIIILLRPSEEIMLSHTCQYFKYFRIFMRDCNIDSNVCLFNSNPRIDPLGSTIEMESNKINFYFSCNDPYINFVQAFLESMCVKKTSWSFFSSEIGLEKKLVDGYIGKEWRFTINFNEIKNQITSKNISELLQLFGNNKFAKGANFKIIDSARNDRFIDRADQMSDSMECDEIYFQSYYKAASPVASILRQLYYNCFKSMPPLISQHKYNENEIVFSLPIKTIIKSDQLPKFKMCLASTLKKEDVTRLGEIIDKLQKLAENKVEERWCRMM